MPVPYLSGSVCDTDSAVEPPAKLYKQRLPLHGLTAEAVRQSTALQQSLEPKSKANNILDEHKKNARDDGA